MGEGQDGNEQKRNRRCGVIQNWRQKEREVYSPRVVFHQDPPETSHQGWEENDVRTGSGGEGNEGQDSREGQACVCPEKRGVRHGCGKPCAVVCSFLCGGPNRGAGKPVIVACCVQFRSPGIWGVYRFERLSKK